MSENPVNFDEFKIENIVTPLESTVLVPVEPKKKEEKKEEKAPEDTSKTSHPAGLNHP